MTIYRRHAPDFKQKVCHEIRSGLIGRREAQQRYDLSDNLIHRWLQRYDAAQAHTTQSAEQALHAAYAEKIRALECKIGQLVMALESSQCDTERKG